MDDVVEDEKKPFDAETAQDDDQMPDPDEQLMLEQGNGRVWLVKIPKFLMERWAAVEAEDIHLATLRVYEPDPKAPPGTPQRIILFLPPSKDSNGTASNGGTSSAAPTPPGGDSTMSTPPPSQPSSQSHSSGSTVRRPYFDPALSLPALETEPDMYELEMINDNVLNQIVVAERPKEVFGVVPNNPNGVGAPSRARTTILTGRIKHECNLRPRFTAQYRRQMRERQRKYMTPKRQIMMIEDAGVPGGQGGVNRLTSGVGMGAAGAAFKDLVKTKPKPAKGAFERMARMPRNQLLDQLFGLFKEEARWNLRLLRERTQQPEVYLKEVLSEIATLHKSGEHNGLWELKDVFKSDGVKAEHVPGPSGEDVKMEDYDDEDDDEDEDEDMEEIS